MVKRAEADREKNFKCLAFQGIIFPARTFSMFDSFSRVYS